MANKTVLPSLFRTMHGSMQQQSQHSNINWTGFTDLKVCGSSQFSQLGLQAVLQHLKTNKLHVIDLRQESHGFVNGIAVTWYGVGAAENAGKSNHAVESDQRKKLQSLAKNKEIRIHRIMEKTEEGKIHKTAPMDIQVQAVMSEEALVKAKGLSYDRVYVQNYYAPTPKEVDRFIDIVSHLRADEWIYFHCRAGVGRTATFMVMMDMLQNAKKVSFADIIKRQAAIGGKNLAALPAPSSFKFNTAKARLFFLQDFYAYAKENNFANHFPVMFSAWKKQQRIHG